MTSASTACSTGNGNRNATFTQPFVVTSIDTTNRLEVAIGITDLWWNFPLLPFTWDVTVPYYTSTTMNVFLYVNTTTAITYLGISYLVSTNLLFDIGSYKYNFKRTVDSYAAGDDVANPDNGTNTFVCTGDYSLDPSNPINKTCRKTTVTVPYNPSVLKNTSANIGVRVFVTGLTLEKVPINLGFRAGTTVGSLYNFTYQATAYGRSQLTQKTLSYTR